MVREVGSREKLLCFFHHEHFKPFGGSGYILLIRDCLSPGDVRLSEFYGQRVLGIYAVDQVVNSQLDGIVRNRSVPPKLIISPHSVPVFVKWEPELHV